LHFPRSSPSLSLCLQAFYYDNLTDYPNKKKEDKNYPSGSLNPSLLPSFPYHAHSLRVNITGIPAQGAKSRVETQIKLGIQLVNQQNERIGAWTHIKLPEYMVAKEKNKRINAKNVGMCLCIVVRVSLPQPVTQRAGSEYALPHVLFLQSISEEFILLSWSAYSRKQDSAVARKSETLSASLYTPIFDPTTQQTIFSI
jgi:hypothetical protein